MKVENKIVELSKLDVNPDNPRFIKTDDYDDLVKSLEEFPEMLSLREIVVDENYMILGGDKRYRALKDLKEKKSPIKIVHGLTDEQKREFIIKDNLSHGDWDYDELFNKWDTVELEEWGLYIFPEEDIKQETGNDIAKEIENFDITEYVVDLGNIIYKRFVTKFRMCIDLTDERLDIGEISDNETAWLLYCLYILRNFNYRDYILALPLNREEFLETINTGESYKEITRKLKNRIFNVNNENENEKNNTSEAEK